MMQAGVLPILKATSICWKYGLCLWFKGVMNDGDSKYIMMTEVAIGKISHKVEPPMGRWTLRVRSISSIYS